MGRGRGRLANLCQPPKLRLGRVFHFYITKDNSFPPLRGYAELTGH